MSAPSWTRVKRVFHEALERDGAERDAFVDEACAADRDLHDEVSSLLAAHDAAGDFINNPLIAVDPEDFEQPARFPHQQIGHYRIVEELGSGGMGHVYLGVRADGEFNKQVAIKVIRASRATPSILQRFRDERQIMADVDHPNIGRLLDGGTTEDGLPYFIMEYVDGEPIDRYCDRHELSIGERLELFIKVCEAVHFAHTQHVIHRDLKPGNILVEDDGKPKLLDFGIAKSVASDDDPPEATEIGERVLTPSYASPEQVRGLRVTPAADVYSLGVLLYLLLTGLRPYNLDKAADYERVICDKQPIPPSKMVEELLHAEDTEGVAPEVSPRRVARARRASPLKMRAELAGNLDGIVLAALAKSPDDRYASAADLASDLRRHLDGETVLGPAAEGLENYFPPPPARSQSTPPAPERTTMSRWALPAVVAALVLAAAWIVGTGLPSGTETEPSLPPFDYPIEPPEGVSFSEGGRSIPTVSPDGRHVLYVGEESDGAGLWLHHVDGSPPSRIAGTDDAMYPFWSPDGDWVGFFAAGRLRFTYVDGTPGLELAPATLEARGATANADGVILFSGDRGESLRRVDVFSDSAAGQEVVARPRPAAGETAYMWPQFLPDGDHFTFFIASDDAEIEGVYVSSLGDPEQRRRLLPSHSSAWFASDFLLYAREETLMARPFDAATLQWSGPEQSLPLRVATTINAQAAFSASPSGILAYKTPETRSVVWLDVTGRAGASIGTPANRRNPAYAPRSRRVAIESHVGNRSEILVFEADGRSNRVQSASTFAENPVWHPDGRHLAFAARFLDEYSLYLWDAGSTDDSVELYSSGSEKMPGDITPDGRFLIYDDKSLDGDWNIRAIDLHAAEPAPIDVVATPGHDSNGRVSPSGDFVAYVTDTAGPAHVYVRRFALADGDLPDPAQDLADCWISDADGGYDPHWGADDDELYYLRSDGRLMFVRLTESSCEREPRPLFDAGVDTPGSSRNHYTLDLDGPRFLFATPRATASSRRVFSNWLDRLRR